ncbi:MAG: FAD-dependent oxidoreductase [Candidatus Hydrogenedentes bacterium]|nr:FAD-dependent oxidoreductase [Candidatus Hydrogenedentota bacterium]
MESALNLGDMGYRVLLVEKEASIGGKMILLSKVFPTLDCASCISTPKMASAAHHPNVTIMVYSEIDEIERKENGTFGVQMHQKPTYVDPNACIGCGQCETACTVAIPDEFNFNLDARRVAHIPFPQAVPKKAILQRNGQSPCNHTCPAGVKPHGYTSLVRAGLHDAAFELHLETTPLIGSLSRACYAPCEKECTRGEFEGSVQIRAIKRFIADRYYELNSEPNYGPVKERKDKRIAIVGAGPAGLNAAFQLARKGYDVTIFEAEEKAGGTMQYGIPDVRLPKDVLERDIKNVTALGVSIRTNTKVESLEKLKQDGFDAVFLGLGCSRTRSKREESADGTTSVKTKAPGRVRSPNTTPFADEIKLAANGVIEINKTLQTSLPYVFAGGDAVTGPLTITAAIGQGNQAAYFIEQFLQGHPLNAADLKELECTDKLAVIAREARLSTRKPTKLLKRENVSKEEGRKAAKLPLTEEEARYSANRCLDCGNCSECHQCVSVCPSNAIDFSMQPIHHQIKVGSVIIATGFELFDAHRKPTFGFGKYPNVVTAMQMDRLLSPTRPFNSVLRPSDGKEPDNIAFVLCVGSRDSQVDHRLCSRVCCMYTAKQAQLIMGSLPLADVTIYYIDIRAFGKGYDEFYEQAKGMGVDFVHGKVADITESSEDEGNLVVRFENLTEGKIEKREHDLVVLSVGLLPNTSAQGMFRGTSIEADNFRYIKEMDEDMEPGVTSIDGVFVAGAANAARDIPDTILHSGAAAVQAAAYIENLKGLVC